MVLDDNGGYDNDGGNEEQQKTQKRGWPIFSFYCNLQGSGDDNGGDNNNIISFVYKKTKRGWPPFWLQVVMKATKV